MAFASIMWVVWGTSLLLMIGVSIFAARLSRNEEAQICLADSSNHMKSEQDEIAAKISKIRPIRMATYGFVGLMTAVVVCYYLLDVMHQFGR